jgi:hypothetical protein
MATLNFRKVRTTRPIDGDAIRVSLFRDEMQRVCGWFLGPVRIAADCVEISYLPRSERVMASVAIVRAMAEADKIGAPLCIVDPMDLWEPAWQV